MICISSASAWASVVFLCSGYDLALVENKSPVKAAKASAAQPIEPTKRKEGTQGPWLAPTGYAQLHESTAARIENIPQMSSAESLAEHIEGRLLDDMREEGTRAKRKLEGYALVVELAPLADDSVQAIEYKFILELGEQGKWQIIQAGERWKCQPGRGAQTWTDDLCI